MVNIYLLPADEGDFIWLRYGNDEDYANILIDGGTKDSGDEYAEIIKWIESHGEMIEALVLTHIDYDHFDLDMLMKKKLGNDSSVNNAASIAFLFEYEDIKVVFLADAKPTVCIKGLKQMKIKMPYPVDILKLSHHGSQYNMSDKLMKSLETNTYMLSTNGHGKKVPNKVAIAHLLKNAGEKKIRLFCNYDWWEIAYHGKFFTDADKEKFLNTNHLELLLPDENGITVKEGLRIYGEWSV